MDSPDPWAKLIMKPSEFTREWLRSNQSGKWHLRIVGENQVRPQLRRLFLHGEIQMPSEIKSEIEDRLAFQVFHLLSPKLLYQDTYNLLKGNNSWAQPDVTEEILTRLEAGEDWVFEAINDANNTIATDGNLGALRELILVCEHIEHSQLSSSLFSYKKNR